MCFWMRRRDGAVCDYDGWTLISEGGTAGARRKRIYQHTSLFLHCVGIFSKYLLSSVVGSRRKSKYRKFKRRYEKGFDVRQKVGLVGAPRGYI